MHLFFVIYANIAVNYIAKKLDSLHYIFVAGGWMSVVGLLVKYSLSTVSMFNILVRGEPPPPPLKSRLRNSAARKLTRNIALS